MSNTEIPSYNVIESFGPIEIRRYPPMIVAEVAVTGERQEAIRQGFRILAGYIFGGNKQKAQVRMTAPVTQEDHTKGVWTVRFGMPSSFTEISALPEPTDSRIGLVKLSEKKFAAIRFSGMIRQTNLDKNYQKLRLFMQEKGLKATGHPIYAFYNPPWTLPFLRRNEVLIELA